MKTTPKDFFLHLGATIALYSAAIALINLAFSIVDKLLPDKLANYFSVSSIVWPISMLIVLVPVLYIIEWLIARDIFRIPEKREIWVRKWRIYLTLFLTGATIVGDLVTLINTYLNGEITARFVYKVLIVLFICCTIFKYYFFTLNDGMYWSNIVKKTVPSFGIIIVLVIIVGGFIIVGSPVAQRNIRFDEQKVTDLSNIENSVARYWQQFATVPDSLSQMPGLTGNIPKDPVTGADYKYVKSSGMTDSFELCSTFFASSTDSNYSYPQFEPASSLNNFYNWTHGAGEVCFKRVISPVDFPPVSNVNTVPQNSGKILTPVSPQ